MTTADLHKIGLKMMEWRFRELSPYISQWGQNHSLHSTIPLPPGRTDSCKQNLRAACPKKDRLEFKFFQSLQWTKLREVVTKSSSLSCKNLLVVYCLVSCSLNKCTLFLWLIWMLKFHFKMYFNSCTYMYSKLDILCNFCFP